MVRYGGKNKESRVFATLALPAVGPVSDDIAATEWRDVHVNPGKVRRPELDRS